MYLFGYPDHGKQGNYLPEERIRSDNSNGAQTVCGSPPVCKNDSGGKGHDLSRLRQME